MKNTFKKLTAGMAIAAVLSNGAAFAEETVIINEDPVADEVVNALAPIEPMVTNFVEMDDTNMVPVRAIAEHFGYTVDWIEDSQSITLTKGAVYVKFAINTNAYSFSKMMAQPLESAPILVDNSTTYVPASLFTELLNLNVRDTDEGLMFYEMRTATVIEINKEENSVLINDNYRGDVLINITESTVVTADGETVEDFELAVGQLIEVEYDNFMTMSIPPMTNAVAIKLLNTVAE